MIVYHGSIQCVEKPDILHSYRPVVDNRIILWGVAMDGNKLENIYQENLEERIMSYLTKTENISYEKSLAIYYKSKLSKKIEEGREGIQYLDYKVLVSILKETEPELFK